MRQTTLIKRYSPTILIRLTYFTYRIIVLFETNDTFALSKKRNEGFDEGLNLTNVLSEYRVLISI